jgi:hypothetical protein
MINRNHLRQLFLLQTVTDANFACFVYSHIYGYASAQEQSNFATRSLLSFKEMSLK